MRPGSGSRTGTQQTASCSFWPSWTCRRRRQTHTYALTLTRRQPVIADKLTSQSSAEQASAELGNCTPEEFGAFQTLNKSYKKIRLPFILAVRGYHRTEILEIFRQRINNRETEFRIALEQVHRIAPAARGHNLEIKEGTTNVSNTSLRRLPWFAENGVNLASPKLGATVFYATDEFFASKERLIQTRIRCSFQTSMTTMAMDGWVESRRDGFLATPLASSARSAGHYRRRKY